MVDGISTDFLVNAHIRLAAREGVPIVVRRRGDSNSGTIILKINFLDGSARLLTQVRLDEELVWSPVKDANISETEADVYLEQQAKFDPDIWLIEIEDKQGRHWFPGRILKR